MVPPSPGSDFQDPRIHAKSPGGRKAPSDTTAISHAWNVTIRRLPTAAEKQSFDPQGGFDR